MQKRKLGSLEVSALGLGCATMTPFYGEPDRDGAIATIHRARELGIDFPTAPTLTATDVTRS